MDYTDEFLLAEAKRLGYTSDVLDGFVRIWGERKLHAKTKERIKECTEGIDKCSRASALLKQEA